MTKTPHSERTRLCLKLLASSADALVYLAGDGVYNLLGQGETSNAGEAGVGIQPSQLGQTGKPDQVLAALLPGQRILACREDLEARGVCAEAKATVPADFYGSLVEEMMRKGSRIYSF